MSIIDAIILGLIQGLTEFIPVSSSGHLILARDFLQTDATNALAFDAVLQLATVFAVFVYFRKDILGLIKTFFKWCAKKPVEAGEAILLKALIIGTIPAIVVGLFLEDYMETVFRSATLVAAMLIVGSLVMWLAEKVATQKNEINLKRGFIIGCFQALALIPGMSRSGSTISGGLFVGLTRETAARFSFLLAAPIIFGSGMKKLLDLLSEGGMTGGFSLLAGSIVAFVVGLAAIHWLLQYLKTKSLMPFVWYRIVLAIVILITL
jgi:undecaprenyl-diphosphatase